MQVSGISYTLNNSRWNYNKNSNINKNNNISQPIAFGAKIKLYDELLSKLTELFSGQFNQAAMPQKASNINLSSSKQLLNFKMTLSNGCTLAVSKFFPDGNKVKKPYLAVKEFGNGAFKEFIGLDLYTKDLIYIDRSAKPVFYCGEYKKISLYDENHPFYESKLESYLKEMFPERTKEIQESNNPQKKHPEITPKPQESRREIPAATPPASEAVTKAKLFNPPAFVVESPVQKAEPEAVSAVVPKTQSPAIPAKVKKETPAQSNTSAKPKRTRIKTSGRVGAVLKPQIQDNIRIINDIMDKLSKVRDEHPSAFKRARISDFKNNYEPIVYTNEKTNRGVTFKFGEGETLKVVTMERKPLKYLGIIHTDKDGHQKLLLIENGDKVVANTNPSNMSFIPPKTYPATEEELKEIPVARYTEFLRESLEKYYSELNKVLQSKDPIKLSPAPVHRSDKVIPQPPVQPANTNPAAADKLISKPDPEKLIPEVKIPDNLDEKLIEKINKQATTDAQKYVQLYMKTFTEQFSKMITEKMAEFQEMLSRFLGGN